MRNSLKKNWNNFVEADVELFKIINEITIANNCPYFLIGAKARDILLGFFEKQGSQRATLDTDIAICCKNWEEFYKIKNQFINSKYFTEDDKLEHRILSSKYGPLDILPFGEIKDKRANIKWPPEYDIELSLIGFDDAYKTSININMDGTNLKVVSPLGLVLLKLLAWSARKNKKDASDLAYFVSNYLDFNNQNTLDNEHSDLLQEFDYTLSGCRLLGRHLKQFSSETREQLGFFNCESILDKLAIDISRSQSHEYAVALNMLHNIKQGLSD